MQIDNYLYDPSVFHFQLFQLGLSFFKKKNKTTVIKGEKWGGRDESGAWDEHIHSTSYKIDNQQRLLTVQHRERCSTFWDNLDEKRI